MNKNKILSGLFIVMIPLLLLSSCDYLDVVPPEQVTADDTMKDRETALGFLYSCYIAVGKSCPFSYKASEASTDEYTHSLSWEEIGQQLAWNRLNASNTAGGHWNACYDFIGHCHLFLRQLERTHPRGATEEDKTHWRAEVAFLKAYYHFRLLEQYGPIPVINVYPDQNISASEMEGRAHYDYVVDYIVGMCDQAAEVLPAYYKNDEDWGRATSTLCKALKARTLLYAASDLWNGSFPYPDWKNVNYETPGYGTELVSKTYSREKWERALAACKEALNYATNEGQRKLMQTEDAMRLVERYGVPMPYVPGVDSSTEEGKTFLEKVLLMRYILNSYETDGNHEVIWGTWEGDDNFQASLPTRIIKQVSDNNWKHGWGGMSPCLYSIENFYTKNGKLPELDNEFVSKGDWLKSAGVPERPEIINLNKQREPRFYAWFSFDGDDYSSMLVNGAPLRVNMRDSEVHGYNPEAFNRDWCTTGYLNKKFCQPNALCNTSGNYQTTKYARPLFRLAELYLNLAECYAALGDVEGTLSSLNPIRERAGVPALTEADVTSEMTLMDWARSERFIELWGEGHRYYDVRRWMIAPEQLKAGAREGLNALVKNPSFEEFNRRTVIDQPFQWENRMYILPISSGELYSDPQLVQAPGY